MSSTRRFEATTAHTEFADGFPILVPNRIDVESGSPHWYVSYNNYDINAYGADTTAIVLGQGEYFIVLLGDHRDGIREAMSSREPFVTALSSVLDYARAHSNYLSKMSDKIF